MSSFITVSSQQGTSKTIVNVNSLNRVSYHLSNSAHKLIENYKLYGSLGLFNADDFYSVLDINGSKVNTLDSIEEIEDKLNEVSGIGHGMTYIPNTVLESSKEVLSHPELLASYLSPFTDYLYKGKVLCGCSFDVSLAWTDEMVKSLLSLFKSCKSKSRLYRPKNFNSFSYSKSKKDGILLSSFLALFFLSCIVF